MALRVEPEGDAAREVDVMRRANCSAEIAAVARTLADEYAPDAPQSLRNEAAVRAAGWLRDMSPALASETRADENSGVSITRQYRGAAANPLRASGGTAILARYVSRRAV